MQLKIVLVIIGIFLLIPACTNFQLNQVTQRFWDNMNGNLKTFNDFNPPDSNNFTFSAMSDSHIGSNGGDVMQKALTASKKDGDLFAIIAGDDSNTGLESELTTFVSQIAGVGLPVYPAIGNHDIFFGGWNHYKTIVGRSIYSFNAGVVHFVILDTANGTFGEDQMNWLKTDLQKNTRPLKVVVQHFPIIVSEFSTIYKLSSDEEATIFVNLMKQFNVQLVISGHYHGYVDRNLGGTRYVVSGAINDILDFGNVKEYVKVTVSSGTHIDIRPINL